MTTRIFRITPLPEYGNLQIKFFPDLTDIAHPQHQAKHYLILTSESLKQGELIICNRYT